MSQKATKGSDQVATKGVSRRVATRRAVDKSIKLGKKHRGETWGRHTRKNPEGTQRWVEGDSSSTQGVDN